MTKGRFILFMAVVFLVALLSVALKSQTVNMGRTYISSQNVRYPNEAGTGTTVNKLAKLTGAPSTAIIAAVTDTEGIIGIVVAGAGAAGSADIAFSGKALCDFDSATTAGHYVTVDTSTAGDCMDTGAATYPTSGQVIGVVTSTNGGAGTYEVDLTIGQPQAGGGGGSSITYGAVAALPAACAVGDVYRTSDSVYEYQCTALNTWTAFFQGQRVVPPPSAGWSWDNQAASTIDSTNGYEYISVPKSGATQITMRYRAAPATPYTIKYLLTNDKSGAPPGAAPAPATTRPDIGFRDAAGKFVTFGFGFTGTSATIISSKWTNSTTFSAAYTQYSGANIVFTQDWVYRQTQWYAISDTGVNLVFYWSIDGLHWKQFDSRARTDFFAAGPDSYAFGAIANGNTVELALLSLEEVASATPF